MSPVLPYKISVLVFLQNQAGEQLLILRRKAPNLGNWSPIGGKLEMATGESPFECAARETYEETGLRIGTDDLHLFAMIAEKAYEGQSHWPMFLFRCRRKLDALPPDISEGLCSARSASPTIEASFSVPMLQLTLGYMPFVIGFAVVFLTLGLRMG